MADPLSGIQASYDAGKEDEFVEPGLVRGVDGRIGDGDGLFFFNFRADRRARSASPSLTRISVNSSGTSWRSPPASPP